MPTTTQTSPQPIHFAALVYQAGIANVFAVDTLTSAPEPGRRAVRLLQHAYGPCLWYARGLSRAGVPVAVYACNRAGDIATADWDTPFDAAPFADAPDGLREALAALAAD